MLYYLGVRPERVQEKKYGYHFPDVDSDDVGTKATAPTAGLLSRIVPSAAGIPRVATVPEVKKSAPLFHKAGSLENTGIVFPASGRF